jgi:hypothetical protein
MPTSVRFRRLFVPASISLILIVAVGWYNFFWLPSKHRYLDDRNFRVLKNLSEQIRLSINNFDKMMDNAADSGITDDRLQDYLGSVAPQLEKPGDEETESIIGRDDNTYGDPPKIGVVADEGTHFLYMAFKRTVQTSTASTKGKRVQYAIRTDLDKLISRVLPPVNRNPFNIVLVAQENGTVIFQKSSPGIEVARIDAFEDESATTKENKPKEAGAGKVELERKDLFQSSRYAEVTLAGARYRLYSQPLQLSFPPIDSGRKGTKKGAPPAPTEKWVLCGLVRADAFRSESQSISYTYMLWLSAAILLSIAAYPFLKLHLSSPIERLHGSDVVKIGVFAWVVAAALTFILMDLYYSRYHFDRAAGEHMKALAEAIDTNFGNEKEEAFAQLRDFYQERDLSLSLLKARASALRLPKLKPDGTECTPNWACRVNILNDKDEERDRVSLERYPYLQFASWSDSDGNQRIKWTTRKSVTPFLNLEKDQSITYYPDVKRALTDVQGAFADRDYPTSAPTQGVGTQYSANTGDNITIFWKLFDLNGNDVPAKDPDTRANPKDVFCASLVTQPISVIDPVLPGGFQFAIIKSDGTVVFHSDRTRNLRENFLDETDQNQEVRSRVLTRASGPLVAKYMGRPHRLYIRPMNASEGQLWTVVVFRDLHLEDTMNLEMLSLDSIMYFLYALAIALGLALAHTTRRSRIFGTWLWPDSRKTSTYRWLAIGNGVAALLLLLLSELPAFLALFFCGLVVPVVAIACNFLLLRRHNAPSSSNGDRDNATSSHWQLYYVGACVTLLVVVAVLPCLCFTKVACDFEYKLIIASSQLRLASDIEERAGGVRRGYQRTDLGHHGGKLLSEPEGETTPYFSYHHILGTSISSAQDVLKEPPTCGMGNPESRERCVELFLGWASPAYDQLAVDNRYLAETGSSGTRRWSSAPVGSQQRLELTKLEPGSKVRNLASLWTPLHIPWTDWRWWLGTIALMTALFGLVRWSLRRIFLLDLAAPVSPENLKSTSDPNSLIAKLSMNLLVIGSDASPTVADLINRRGVQAWDLEDVLNAAQHSAKTADGTSFVSSSTGDQVDEIIRDGRPLLLYNCDATFSTPRTNHQSLVALERIASNLGASVVIAANGDPAMKAPAAQNGAWLTLLQSFVRIDLKSNSAQRVDETLEQFESRISAEGYQRWLFPRRSRPQKLVLVHLAQERLVSPNSGGIVRELMTEGIVLRRWGLVTIKDSRFAEFVRCAVPPDTIKHWEGQGAGTRSASLRTSLLVVGAAVAGFLIYTQGEIFNTWVTYVTGVAAAVPAFIRVFAVLRGKSGAEA